MLTDGVAENQAGTRTLISILMPLYNEEAFVSECLSRVLHAPFPENTSLEVIVVDDGSTDESADSVLAMRRKSPNFLCRMRLARNRGKGAASRTTIERASGDLCVIQDGDREYPRAEYPTPLKPLLAGDAPAVFGSRCAFTCARRGLY